MYATHINRASLEKFFQQYPGKRIYYSKFETEVAYTGNAGVAVGILAPIGQFRYIGSKEWNNYSQRVQTLDEKEAIAIFLPEQGILVSTDPYSEVSSNWLTKAGKDAARFAQEKKEGAKKGTETAVGDNSKQAVNVAEKPKTAVKSSLGSGATTKINEAESKSSSSGPAGDGGTGGEKGALWGSGFWSGPNAGKFQILMAGVGAWVLGRQTDDSRSQRK